MTNSAELNIAMKIVHMLTSCAL